MTGSRDTSGKLFLPGSSPGNFIEAMMFRGPNHFVSSICVINPTAEAISKGITGIKIFLGSHDANIYVYSEEESQPLHQLIGHSSTVSCLTGNDSNGRLLSGSWDMTAILWEGEKKLAVIFGHEQAVWATAFLGSSDILLTGSADHSIRAWSSSAELKETFFGHTDCVRSLSGINDELFMSCSNDGTLKRWRMGHGLVKSYDCHTNYIYSMDWIIDPETGNKIGFMSCSEDKSVRLFIKGLRVQVIPVPGITPWDVIAMKAGKANQMFDDIAVASSTGFVFIFSRDPEKKASTEEVTLYKGLIDETPAVEGNDIETQEILESLEQLLKFD